MPSRSTRTLLALLAATWGVAACGQPWPDDVIDPANPAKRAVGEEVYRTYCAACHGSTLEGQPDWHARRSDGRLPAPPQDATGPARYRSDDELVSLVRDGLQPPLFPDGYQSDMPAFAGILSDDEIRAVLAYIQSTWPADVLKTRRDAQLRRSGS